MDVSKPIWFLEIGDLKSSSTTSFALSESAKWRACVLACFACFMCLVCLHAWCVSWNGMLGMLQNIDMLGVLQKIGVLDVLQKIGILRILHKIACLACLKN